MMDTAVKAAREAGKILMENFGKVDKIEKKEDKSLVTDIDMECEEKIKSIIKEKFPEHSILCEETGEEKKDSDYEWVVDPLDGTHNYVYEMPAFGVSIALAHKGHVILGVVYLPFFDQLFTAERGKGAFLNNEKINVSDRKLKDSVLSYDSWWFKHDYESSTKTLKKFMDHIFGVRVSGCCSHNLCLLAKGNYGLFISSHHSPWDIAASLLIAEEAGAVIKDFDGGPWNIYTKGILVGNKDNFEEAFRLLKC